MTEPREKAEKLATGVIDGQRLAVARAISMVEDERDGAVDLLRGLYRQSRQAHIIGVTGAPGTGKSTLVTSLAQSYRAQDQTVAVVAIDPTSPFTGGALLGDRVRMRALSGDDGIFIRSMATRGSLGGLSKTTSDVVTVLDAAGFDRIIVETVGVGQAEIEIVSTAHTTVVVEAPGLGDEVQAIKAGVLEIADLLVVNKADRPGTKKTIQALEMVMEVDRGVTKQVRHHGQLLTVESPPNPVLDENGWDVAVLKTVATTGDGIEDLREQIEAHFGWLTETGELATREALRIGKTIENVVRTELNRRIRTVMPQDHMGEMVTRIQAREVDPYEVAEALLDRAAAARTVN